MNELRQVTADELEDVLHEQSRPVLVEFGADWCEPCRFLAPELVRMGEALGDRLTVVTVDIDENRELAERFTVNALPTMALIDRGVVRMRITGSATAEELLAELEPVLRVLRDVPVTTSPQPGVGRPAADELGGVDAAGPSTAPPTSARTVQLPDFGGISMTVAHASGESTTVDGPGALEVSPGDLLGAMVSDSGDLDRLDAIAPDALDCLFLACDLRDGQLAAVGRHVRLTELVIAGATLDGSGLSYLPPRLTTLVLDGAPLAAGLGALGDRPELRDLQLSGAQDLTDDGLLDGVAGMPHLTGLAIEGDALSDEGLARALRALPALTRIRLQVPGEGSSTLAALADAHQCEDVSLTLGRLTASSADALYRISALSAVSVDSEPDPALGAALLRLRARLSVEVNSVWLDPEVAAALLDAGA